MSEEFVLAEHTETHLLQRVPRHYIDTFPYFRLAEDRAVKEDQGATPKAVEKPKTKEGAK